MANTGKLLTLTESAELAGVATETLEQYRNFGLLEVVEQQGAPFFKESDIRTLFYTRPKDAAKSDAGTINHSVMNQSSDEVEEESGPLKLNEILAEENAASAEDKEPSVDGAVASDTEESIAEATEADKLQALEEDVSAEETRDIAKSQAASEEGGFHARVPAITDRELVEITKGLRQQVEMLREERDWLRERVEKLEARSEREQMMLLSESETLRSLIEPQIQRKRETFWRRTLLPLFGFEQNKR